MRNLFSDNFILYLFLSDTYGRRWRRFLFRMRFRHGSFFRKYFRHGFCAWKLFRHGFLSGKCFRRGSFFISFDCLIVLFRKYSRDSRHRRHDSRRSVCHRRRRTESSPGRSGNARAFGKYGRFCRRVHSVPDYQHRHSDLL